MPFVTVITRNKVFTWPINVKAIETACKQAWLSMNAYTPPDDMLSVDDVGGVVCLDLDHNTRFGVEVFFPYNYRGDIFSVNLKINLEKELRCLVDDISDLRINLLPTLPTAWFKDPWWSSPKPAD